jgi:hypothetical protein
LGQKNSVHSPVEPSVRRGIHLVQLMEDRVRGLVSEVVDDVLHTQQARPVGKSSVNSHTTPNVSMPPSTTTTSQCKSTMPHV